MHTISDLHPNDEVLLKHIFGKKTIKTHGFQVCLQNLAGPAPSRVAHANLPPLQAENGLESSARWKNSGSEHGGYF